MRRAAAPTSTSNGNATPAVGPAFASDTLQTVEVLMAGCVWNPACVLQVLFPVAETDVGGALRTLTLDLSDALLTAAVLQQTVAPLLRATRRTGANVRCVACGRVITACTASDCTSRARTSGTVRSCCSC